MGNGNGKQGETISRAGVTTGNNGKQWEINSRAGVTTGNNGKQRVITLRVEITTGNNGKQREITSRPGITTEIAVTSPTLGSCELGNGSWEMGYGNVTQRETTGYNFEGGNYHGQQREIVSRVRNYLGGR